MKSRRLVLPLWPSQVVYDFTEKNDSSLDLIEKNTPRSDSVYDLTEIDSRNKRQQEEPPVGLEAGSQLKSQGKWLGVGGTFLWDFTYLCWNLTLRR